MTTAVVALTVVVAILVLLVAGLLRSHATILKRLHELGAGIEPPAGTPAPPAAAAPSPDPALPRPPEVPEGRQAADLAGVGPRGEALALRIAGAPHDTVVAFLSSGCTTCHVYWEQLRDPQLADGTRLVVVTKGPDEESPVAVAQVAPPDVSVVMSSEAWTAYGVPGSPYVVHVDGASGRIRGEGTGPTWNQVRRMLLQGAGDLDARRGAKATSDARREAEVDEILRGAGIRPGDPSLYVRADGTSVQPE